MDFKDETAEMPLDALGQAMSRQRDDNGADAEMLRQQAERCRRLSHSIGDRQTSEALASLANEYLLRADGVLRPN